MKKLGKKGVTLVELIVSFALVAVACVYFYQTLVTVTDLYRLASKETDDFVNEAYTFRILDEKVGDNKFTLYSQFKIFNISNSNLTKLGCKINSINKSYGNSNFLSDSSITSTYLKIVVSFDDAGAVTREYYKYLKK